MRKVDFVMGMPVIIEIVDNPQEKIFKKVFGYFRDVDERFSPYKQNSIVTKMNDGRLNKRNLSDDMKLILKLSEETKNETDGYFDVYREEKFDPSGVVKGWAINSAAKIIADFGVKNYCVEAGGDIQTFGLNKDGQKWAIGIRNPFNVKEIVKVVYLSGEGVATSGTSERGNHIYNPKGEMAADIVSLTIIGPNIYEADRFATAAFAMGVKGIEFIERLDGFEGYMINKDGIATVTSGWGKYDR